MVFKVRRRNTNLREKRSAAEILVMCQVKFSLLKELRHRFAHLEKLNNLNDSSSSLAIRVYLLHPEPAVKGLSLSLWCFAISITCYFHVSFSLKVILYMVKILRLSSSH